MSKRAQYLAALTHVKTVSDSLHVVRKLSMPDPAFNRKPLSVSTNQNDAEIDGKLFLIVPHQLFPHKVFLP